LGYAEESEEIMALAKSDILALGYLLLDVSWWFLGDSVYKPFKDIDSFSGVSFKVKLYILPPVLLLNF